MAACGGENEPPESEAKVLAFLALFMLPGLLLPGGAGRHEQAKTTRFCVSCHEIKPYWESLHIDAPRFLPAAQTPRRLSENDHSPYLKSVNLDENRTRTAS